MAVNETNNTTEQGYRLPCGRELEQVWERLDAVESGRPDAHEAVCPHCRAARESLLALRAATRELVAEPEPPPPGLTGRIMSAVRSEMRRGRTVDLPDTGPGSVEISAQAVAAVLRYAADSVPGVRARRCRIRQAGADDGAPRTVDVEMSIALPAGGPPVGDVLPAVRARIAAALPDHIGVELRRLDVHIADLYHADGPGPGGDR
ncbi:MULTISPECIES: Asp23/Gls24 family envelope stress response protein [Nocardia]|uniref:Asp23/Gls24 family envelope stress response protein n=1 Tax=Nocardia TaxID=1817 RepID=UPI001893C89A|nr:MULTISPECIES: Asp23/Gls24 family envelope stress response protein [Nocardia]MBF6351604.1 Asp23/Gls24 family envelope stress response protein [Nocardia flavorosea]